MVNADCLIVDRQYTSRGETEEKAIRDNDGPHQAHTYLFDGLR